MQGRHWQLSPSPSLSLKLLFWILAAEREFGAEKYVSDAIRGNGNHGPEFQTIYSVSLLHNSASPKTSLLCCRRSAARATRMLNKSDDGGGVRPASDTPVTC